MKKEQNIKCNVKSCEYQNERSGECELKEIKISADKNCSNDNVCDCGQTICSSFKCSKNQ